MMVSTSEMSFEKLVIEGIFQDKETQKYFITEWPMARSGGPSCPGALSAMLPYG
jgi:hypothetical protein